MKIAVHPKYYLDTQVTCSCGNRFTIGSTVEIMHIELCSKCHPFYTGDQRFVDRGSLIQNFQRKQAVAKQYQSKKVEKIEKQKNKENEPKTLREMLMGTK